MNVTINVESLRLDYGYSPEQIKIFVEAEDLIKFLLRYDCDTATETHTLELFRDVDYARALKGKSQFYPKVEMFVKTFKKRLEAWEEPPEQVPEEQASPEELPMGEEPQAETAAIVNVPTSNQFEALESLISEDTPLCPWNPHLCGLL